MRIKITNCSNPILWYRDWVGYEFDVRYQEDNAYWTREPTWPNALNWVYERDAEVIKEME